MAIANEGGISQTDTVVRLLQPTVSPLRLEIAKTKQDALKAADSRSACCAIGFRKRMVQLSFLIESSFLALTSIVVGSGLGLVVASNVISDSRRTPSRENRAFTVPWLTLAVIFLIVYAVALATTLAPAVRASRIYPAEALRYQ